MNHHIAHISRGRRGTDVWTPWGILPGRRSRVAAAEPLPFFRELEQRLTERCPVDKRSATDRT